MTNADGLGSDSGEPEMLTSDVLERIDEAKSDREVFSKVTMNVLL